ncbi:MAG: PrsW family intramembrane metalloprotease [Eubacterium sp.]|nr:PrsW family intramembrane metalloprotease [Eubacterium sp.]
MDNISYILYVCVLIPMLLSLFILEKRSRLVVGYILIGMTSCLFVSEINGYLYDDMNKDMLYFCTTVSPITEEIVKGIPILFYAFFVSNNRSKLVQASFAVGLGFAILENMIILTQNIDGITLSWAIIRGFGAGLLHSVCTVAVGLGISFVRMKKKLFVCGTIALLMLAMTYHAIYNTIVMSEYKYFGFVLPLVTYIAILVLYLVIRKAPKKEKQ